MRCRCLKCKEGSKGGKCLKVLVSIYNTIISTSIFDSFQLFHKVLNSICTSFEIQPGIKVYYEISCSPALAPYLTVVYTSSDEIDWNAASRHTGVKISVTSNTEWEINSA